MRPYKSLWSLGAAAPLAAAAVLAAAPQAGAAVGGASVSNPQVVSGGAVLNVQFTSAVSDRAADAVEARDMATSLVGAWAGALVDQAVAQMPAQTSSSCRVTATATDPDGAAGTVSATVPTGVATTALQIPDQAAGTKWGVGDLDHFTVQLTCTDTQLGNNVSKAVIDQDAFAI